MPSGVKSKNPFPSKAVPDELVRETSEVLRPELKALIICLSHSWGGLEQVAVQDTLELAALELDVRFLCLEGSPIHHALEQNARIPFSALSYQPRNFLDFKLRSEILKFLESGVNLVHTHQTTLLGSIVPWLWKHPKIALLATRHILNDHDKTGFIHRTIYSRLDWLLVMSQTLRKNVLSTHAISPHRVKTVNLGLDFSLFDPSQVDPSAQREAWGIDSDTKVIGIVGRIDLSKGQGTFIKAAAGLLKNPKTHEKLKFVIVGEETLGAPSEHMSELKEMVKQFHLEDDVLFTGYQKNISEIMMAFDIFVMPSRQEAFGLVAIEAMAMERPIVISKGGSAEEIVGDEKFGLTMRPDDAFDLQMKLRYLLDHPSESAKMGKRAREHIKTQYDRHTRLAKTLSLYQRALKSRCGFVSENSVNS